MSFGIDQTERRTPGTTEYHPACDAELNTNTLHIGDEMRRGVVGELRMRGGAPGATRVEQHDAIDGGIEETTVIGFAAGTGAAVHEHHRQAFGVAALLDVESMNLVDLEAVRGVRLDIWIKGQHHHHRFPAKDRKSS